VPRVRLSRREHDRELAAFGFRSFATGAVGRDRMFRSVVRRFSAQRGDRIEENAAMANRRHAEVSEVLGGHCLVDRIFPECLFVAFQVEAAQPGRDIHAIYRTLRRHSSAGCSRRHVGRSVGRALPVWLLAHQPSQQNEIVASLLHPTGRNTPFLACEAVQSMDQPGASP
jgi:hypothetical protein